MTYGFSTTIEVRRQVEHRCHLGRHPNLMNDDLEMEVDHRKTTWANQFTLDEILLANNFQDAREGFDSSSALQRR